MPEAVFIDDLKDSEILALAHLNSAVVITRDWDYFKLAAYKGKPHSGIIILCGGLSPDEQVIVAINALLTCKEELSRQAIIHCDRNGVQSITTKPQQRQLFIAHQWQRYPQPRLGM